MIILSNYATDNSQQRASKPLKVKPQFPQEHRDQQKKCFLPPVCILPPEKLSKKLIIQIKSLVQLIRLQIKIQTYRHIFNIFFHRYLGSMKCIYIVISYIKGFFDSRIKLRESKITNANYQYEKKKPKKSRLIMFLQNKKKKNSFCSVDA